jgi:tetratricopeptide (TPR) repeat protein
MIGVAALIGGSLLLTLSRGAIAAFVAGQLLFVLVRVVTRAMGREAGEPRRNLAWLPLGLALSLGLGLFAAQDAIIGEYLQGDFHKVEMLREGMPLVGDFPAFGVGRGAFWVAFPLVSEWAARITFTHAENSVVQLLADWGVLIGGGALLGFGLVVARRLVKPPARIRPTAALVGLVAFGVHNLFDFNMEVPGVAVLAAALLGTLIGSEGAGRGRSSSRNNQGVPVPRPLLAGFAAIALAMGAITALYAAPHSIDAEERRLREALARDDAAAFSPENMQQRLERHPASWYLPFLAGVHEFHAGGENPLPWLARALEINPAAAAAHLYAGRAILQQGGLDQAMLEFRLASRGNSRLGPPAARYLVEAAPSFDRLSRIAVDREDKLLLWGALAREFSVQGLEEEAEAADLAVLSIDPDEPRSLARHARRMIKRDELDRALELAERLEELDEFRPAAAILEAEIHRKRGATDEELRALEQGLHRSPRHPGLLRELAWAAQRAGDHDRAMSAAAELRSTATDQSQRSAAAVLEGDLERAEGRIDAALARYRQAYAMNPSNPALLEKIANLALSHGDDLRALEALRKLVNLDPTNPEWRRRLDELEKKGRTKPFEIP